MTPQQQDAKIGTEDFEEEHLEVINGTSFLLKPGLKHITLGHIRTAVVDEATAGGIKAQHGTTQFMKQVLDHGDVQKTDSEPADTKVIHKLPIPTFTGLDPGEKPFRCKICGK